MKGRVSLEATSRDGVAIAAGDRTVVQGRDVFPRVTRRRGWLMRRLLLMADVAGLLVGFVFALALVPPAEGVDNVGSPWEIVLFVATLPLWVFLARDPWPLRPRRRANRPLDGGRRGRDLPGGDPRDVVLPRL